MQVQPADSNYKQNQTGKESLASDYVPNSGAEKTNGITVMAARSEKEKPTPAPMATESATTAITADEEQATREATEGLDDFFASLQ